MISFSTRYLETQIKDLYVVSAHVTDISGRTSVVGDCMVPCCGRRTGVVHAGDIWVQPAQKQTALAHSVPILQPARAAYSFNSSGRFKEGW